ncbi:hypothetical protein JTB14_012109 [Gonioctena quinquepunctata]|nr:hypothetical protein JTB14_012109 [Gonioctena quinquepunctata]
MIAGVTTCIMAPSTDPSPPSLPPPKRSGQRELTIHTDIEDANHNRLRSGKTPTELNAMKRMGIPKCLVSGMDVEKTVTSHENPTHHRFHPQGGPAKQNGTKWQIPLLTKGGKSQLLFRSVKTQKSKTSWGECPETAYNGRRSFKRPRINGFYKFIECTLCLNMPYAK